MFKSHDPDADCDLDFQLHPDRRIPNCLEHPLNLNPSIKSFQYVWYVLPEGAFYRWPIQDYSDNRLIIMHVQSDICAGSDSPTTYTCAEYVTRECPESVWYAHNGHVKRQPGWLVLDGPKGTRNKMLVEGDFNGLQPVALAKFSHDGYFLDKKEAYEHANEIIAREFTVLQQMQFRNFLVLRDLELAEA